MTLQRRKENEKDDRGTCSAGTCRLRHRRFTGQPQKGTVLGGSGECGGEKTGRFQAFKNKTRLWTGDYYRRKEQDNRCP